jgi:hypothetical protein
MYEVLDQGKRLKSWESCLIDGAIAVGLRRAQPATTNDTTAELHYRSALAFISQMRPVNYSVPTFKALVTAVCTTSYTRLCQCLMPAGHRGYLYIKL